MWVPRPCSLRLERFARGFRLGYFRVIRAGRRESPRGGVVFVVSAVPKAGPEPPATRPLIAIEPPTQRVPRRGTPSRGSW